MLECVCARTPAEWDGDDDRRICFFCAGFVLAGKNVSRLGRSHGFGIRFSASTVVHGRRHWQKGDDGDYDVLNMLVLFR